MSTDLAEFMSLNREGERIKPLQVFTPDDKTIVGVYQGRLSEFDLLVKYRQLINGKWSRVRTPKHIHWAVDLLIKMHEDKTKIQSFLDFLIEVWAETRSLRSVEEREEALKVEILLDQHKDKIEEYRSISSLGEYRVEFLILLAKLLMIQEKTNREEAYMFKKLLEALRQGEDIFSIVSKASYTGR